VDVDVGNGLLRRRAVGLDNVEPGRIELRSDMVTEGDRGLEKRADLLCIKFGYRTGMADRNDESMPDGGRIRGKERDYVSGSVDLQCVLVTTLGYGAEGAVRVACTHCLPM
jgi:hypothetical protein